MKKVMIAVLALGLMFTACKKNQKMDCSCGIITSKDPTFISITVKNNCSNNEKTFYSKTAIKYQDVGDSYCTQQSW